MPKLAFFNTIFREPWLLDPQTAAAQRQVLMGILMGLEFAPEDGEVQASIDSKQSPAIPKGRKVNLINVEGTMLRDDAGCGLMGTRTMASLLREAEADKTVLGHIIRFDSGGGTVNSVPDLAEAIQDCKKPVVAFVDGYMCSAAHYVGSYCDHIMANRADDCVGSIGVLMQIEDYPKQAKDSDGMVHLRIYADGSEDKNGEFEAALEGNFQLLKDRKLNPIAAKFRADIRQNRPDTRDDQLTGRTYTAAEAVGTLIDSIGNFEAAVNKVVELSNITITKMEGLKDLQAVPSCKDLQEVEGSVSLNKEQLTDIDAELANQKALAQNANKTVNEQAATISQLQSENATLKTTNESQATEIASLKATIEELNKKPTPSAPAVHNGDPLTDNLEFADDPEAYCEDLLKRMGKK